MKSFKAVFLYTSTRHTLKSQSNLETTFEEQKQEERKSDCAAIKVYPYSTTVAG